MKRMILAALYPRACGLALTLATSLLADEPQPTSFAFRFAEATVDDLQAQMAAGALTTHELTAAYLTRIEQIDRAGPTLRAVIETNPDALAIADQLDAERRAGKVRGPLHGIPVLIKDNIGTADKMETTAGSLALVGARPPRDAFIVTRLRKAGAVILGKTNPSEWAYSLSFHAPNGWSARGGLTRNPYVLDRTPNGSSSGSAVAVSANLCVAAIGTETDGSILCPASMCGVVGFKPTVGLASRRGIIPVSSTQDTPGPLTRTVRDAAIVLAALAGRDAEDSATSAAPEFSAALAPHALRGARLGVAAVPATFFPPLAPVRERVVAALRTAGATIVDLPPLAASPELLEAENTVLDFELKAGLEAWFAHLGPTAPLRSLADLIAFNRDNRDRELPFFGQEVLEHAQARGPLTDPGYRAALATCRRLARTEGLDPLLGDGQLDAIVAVTCGPAFTVDPLYGVREQAASSAHAAIAGYPSITVPAAEIHGLPVGVSFIGPAWSDAKLLALTTDFESQTQTRREPQFLPTLAVDYHPSALLPTIDAVVEAERARQQIPGVAIAVVHRGTLLAAKGYGFANVEHQVPVTAETISQSGSLGKQLTAAVALSLVEEGKLSLDDRVTSYLPAAPATWQPITIRHLLTHTSGIADYEDGVLIDYWKNYTDEEFDRIIFAQALEFPAGAHFHYCNAGYDLLGQILQKISGQSLPALYRERLFKPAGMSTARVISEADIVPHRAAGYETVDGALKNQRWVAPSFNETMASGCLYLSALDLVAWDKTIRERSVLRPESWAAMFSPARLTSGRIFPYGFGWRIEEVAGQVVQEHDGAWQGFRAYIARFLSDDLTVLVLANHGEAETSAFVTGIAALFNPALADWNLVPIRSGSAVGDPPAIPDREPQVTTRLRGLLENAAVGKLSADDFAYLHPGAFPVLAEALRHRLAGAGALQDIVLVGRRELGDDIAYRYTARFGAQRFTVNLWIAPTGKVTRLRATEIPPSAEASAPLSPPS